MGFFIVAAVFLLLGAGLGVRNWRRSRRWARAAARKSHIKTYVHRDLDGDRTLMDQLSYQFRDSRGSAHALDVRDYSGFRDGDSEVLVLYDPHDPSRAMIATARDMYGLAGGLLVCAAWLLVFGFLSMG